jgi:hypothetical protein
MTSSSSSLLIKFAKKFVIVAIFVLLDSQSKEWTNQVNSALPMMFGWSALHWL